jgi:hypothetical protein
MVEKTIEQAEQGVYRLIEAADKSASIVPKTKASLPLDAIRRPSDTPIWKLEASLKCRSCRKGRHAPPVRMIASG